MEDQGKRLLLVGRPRARRDRLRVEQFLFPPRRREAKDRADGDELSGQAGGRRPRRWAGPSDGRPRPPMRRRRPDEQKITLSCRPPCEVTPSRPSAAWSVVEAARTIRQGRDHAQGELLTAEPPSTARSHGQLRRLDVVLPVTPANDERLDDGKERLAAEVAYAARPRASMIEKKFELLPDDYVLKMVVDVAVTPRAVQLGDAAPALSGVRFQDPTSPRTARAAAPARRPVVDMRRRRSRRSTPRRWRSRPRERRATIKCDRLRAPVPASAWCAWRPRIRHSDESVGLQRLPPRGREGRHPVDPGLSRGRRSRRATRRCRREVVAYLGPKLPRHARGSRRHRRLLRPASRTSIDLGWFCVHRPSRCCGCCSSSSTAWSATGASRSSC